MVSFLYQFEAIGKHLRCGQILGNLAFIIRKLIGFFGFVTGKEEVHKFTSCLCRQHSQLERQPESGLRHI